MNDLISREAAIDMLKAAYWDNDIQSAKDDPCIVDAITDWAIRQVKALPSAQRWIPVTERLPEKSEMVLVCLDTGDITDGYHEERTWWCGLMDRCFSDREETVVAWMPLPEPYKAERSEE